MLENKRRGFVEMKMLAQWLGGASVMDTDVQQAIMKSLGLCEIDAASGKIASVNARLCELLARSEQELLGSRLADYCSDSFLRSHITAHISDSASASSQQADTELTMTYSPVHGGLRWFNLRFSSLNSFQLKNKAAPRLLVLITDETHRHNHDAEHRINSTYANALEQCQANIMLVDNDMLIVFMNKSIKAMLKARANVLQAHLPSFCGGELIGQSADIFHVGVSNQRELMTELQNPYKTEFNVANLIFGLVSKPWCDDNGVRLGTLMEWEDKTDDRALEKK